MMELEENVANRKKDAHNGAMMELLENGVSGKNHAHSAVMMSLLENEAIRKSMQTVLTF